MKIIALFATLLVSAISTHAAYTDNFDALRAELAARAGALTGSLDKVEQKQGKACLKAIATIDKPADDLGDDTKTAGKVVKSLIKVFPGDFATLTSARGLVVVNLATLVNNLVAGLTADVNDALDDLQTAINALPAGSAKTNAQAAYDAALAILDSLAPDYATLLKELGTAYKNVAKGQAIANAGGGGGGATSLTMQIDGTPWSADSFIGVDHVATNGEFALGGTLTSPASILNIIIPSGVTGPGTYPLTGNGFYQVGIFPTIPTIYNITSGSITITTLNSTTASGTFAFTASDGSTTVTISQGAFTAPVSH